MPSCLLAYLSQGGTTRRIAEAIAAGLRARGLEVTLHDLAHGPPPDPAGFDLLGAGTPAHYYRPALVVSDFVERLPELAGKPFFTFMLHAAYPGDAGTHLRRALLRKGGRELGYARFRGEGHFLGYLRHGYLFSPASPRPEALAEAERFGGELAARLAGRPHEPAPYDAPTPLIYRLERFLTGRLLIRHLYSRLFRLDRSACQGCGRCVRACPTGNIRALEDGGRVWGRECILCFACERDCPRGAIGAPLTWLLFWPFMAYNTRAAAADPAIGRAPVEHAGGRTTIVP